MHCARPRDAACQRRTVSCGSAAEQHEGQTDGSHRRPEFAPVLSWHESRPKAGDLIEPGYNSNYGERKKAAYVYLTATLNAATWGAELALAEGPGRIYMVETTGPIKMTPI
jgi:hypothetical protein